MRCKICIDPTVSGPSAVITAPTLTPEVEAAASLLRRCDELVLNGYTPQGVRVLTQPQLLRVYAAQKKVYAQTVDGETCTLRARLHELEEQLDDGVFVRISNAEIVNSRCIHHLDVSLSGTIGVYLDGGVKTFASRRYVPKIKKFFGL